MIDRNFKELGFRRCYSDYCIYVKESTIIALYMYDILIISDSLKDINETKDFLKNRFRMEDMGEAKRFLGMDINRLKDTGNVRISQKDYIESVLKKFGMENCRPAKTPFAPGTKLWKFDETASE